MLILASNIIRAVKDLDKIIERILEGETDLFRLLVEYYHNRIFILIRGFVHQEQDAQDLTQETFINAFVSLGSFRGKSEFSTWLYRIAVNTTYSFLRKRERAIPFLINRDKGQGGKVGGVWMRKDFMPIGKEKSPHDQASERQINSFIYKEIDRLPKNQRTAFVLSRIEEMSQKEIAQVMGVSVRAVESLLQRAKRNLKSKLKIILDESEG